MRAACLFGLLLALLNVPAYSQSTVVTAKDVPVIHQNIVHPQYQ